MTLIERAKQLRPLIVKAAQSLEDKEALTCLEFYDNWSSSSVNYPKNYKVKYNRKLYKVLMEHISQPSWNPEVAVSLFMVIDEEHTGTLEDPIPYSGNMELFNGKYYIQNEIIYLCNRNSGVPVYNNLEDLVGLYVEKIK